MTTTSLAAFLALSPLLFVATMFWAYCRRVEPSRIRNRLAAHVLAWMSLALGLALAGLSTAWRGQLLGWILYVVGAVLGFGAIALIRHEYELAHRQVRRA